MSWEIKKVGVWQPVCSLGWAGAVQYRPNPMYLICNVPKSILSSSEQLITSSGQTSQRQTYSRNLFMYNKFLGSRAVSTKSNLISEKEIIHTKIHDKLWANKPWLSIHSYVFLTYWISTMNWFEFGISLTMPIWLWTGKIGHKESS